METPSGVTPSQYITQPINKVVCVILTFSCIQKDLWLCAMQQLTEDEPSCNPVLISELPTLKALKAVDIVTEKPLSAVSVSEYNKHNIIYSVYTLSIIRHYAASRIFNEPSPLSPRLYR